MKIERRPDWQNRFVAYMSSVVRLPFDDRVRSCGHFIADGVKEMTDFDLLRGLRSSKNLSEMLERLEKRGFKKPSDYIASLFPETTSIEARPGDLILVDGEGGESFGFLQGDYAYAIGARGVMMVPRDQVRRFFKV